MNQHITFIDNDTPHIAHYGILRRSGRYPWGSGGELLSTVDRLHKQGLTEKEIAKGLGVSTTDLRLQKALASMAQKEADRLHVTRMREAGQSVESISSEMGIAPSTIRDMLKPAANLKYKIIQTVANVLKMAIEKYHFIDVGDGVEHYLGVSSTKLKQAVALLMNEGYTKHYIRQEQLGTGKKTSVMVLAAPGTEYKEVYANRSNISIPNFHSEDMGESFSLTDGPISNITANQIAVVDVNNGGANRDGLIELRRGVADLDLGEARYAQVRIGVDGTHYIKGVAVYSDNMPPGKNIVFHSSKSVVDGDPLSVLKPQEPDPDNPFGSFVYAKHYINEEGVKKRSALNIVYQEEDWSDWSRTLSSQFLSKQSPKLAKQQLTRDYEKRVADLDEILALDNPTLKEHLLRSYADEADSAAVVLKAAAMPNQTNNVLIPILSMKETEVYAPFYENGTKIVAIRHPHGGKFEIPRLTVNNKNPEAKAILGNSNDAIGIHPKVAAQLSGADFDGDTVITFPDKRGEIMTSPPLDALKSFNPREAYPYYEGVRLMTKPGKQRKMGEVSNLITDMTIKGASESEIARAVKHSMVVIDSEKHKLNWEQSYIDNGIASLREKYQGGARAGASTLVSRSKGQERVPHRKDVYAIDPTTGEKVFSYTHETYLNKRGEEVARQTVSSKMYEADDANVLSSGTVIERVYADYANSVKALGNKARLESTKQTPIKLSREARKTYANEVNSLETKLRIAQKHQPLERKAQAIAGEMVRIQRKNKPGMSASDIRTAKGKALVLARDRVGSKRKTIEITPREWEAIQMGAVSTTRLNQILRNSDQNAVKTLATPRALRGMTPDRKNRARILLNAGYTTAEVAQVLGVTPNQVANMDD